MVRENMFEEIYPGARSKGEGPGNIGFDGRQPEWKSVTCANRVASCWRSTSTRIINRLKTVAAP
jgi:hypothetical protein